MGVLLVTIVLGVQHARQGWPFAPEPPPAPAGRPAMASAPAPAPRAPVDVPRARWRALQIHVITVRRETIGGELRAALSLVPDETRVASVRSPLAGTVERRLRMPGEAVQQGQPLFTIASEELREAQKDFFTHRAAQASRDRLIALGMTEPAIAELERTGAIDPRLTIAAPSPGVILRVGVVEGGTIDPTTELAAVADLRQLWGVCELPELQGADVGLGSVGTLNIPSSDGDPFEATIVSVQRIHDERRVHAAFAVPNSQERLQVGMIGSATIEIGARPGVVVPRSAIVDTGYEQHVFVLDGASTFVPRPVRLGVQRGSRVEITDGLVGGERVASRGVFSIDSLSRRRADGEAIELGPRASE